MTTGGDVHREVTVAPFPEVIDRPSVWLLANDTWQRHVAIDGLGQREVWHVDPGAALTRLVASLEYGDCGGLYSSVAATPDGGFVALEKRGASSHRLRCFGADGVLRWESGRRNAEDPASLVAPEDVAVLADGRVVVVDSIRRTLQVFWPDGDFSHAVELDDVFERGPEWPFMVTPDGSGVLLRDLDGLPEYWRVGLDGSVRTAFRLPPEARRWRDPVVAPDGKLWMTDGHRLYTLDASGAIDSTIGEQSDIETMHDPSNAVVDPLGRIHIFDSHTRAVHVFDRTGERVLLCRSLEDSPRPGGSSFAFGPAGGIYIGTSGHGAYLRFDAAGEDTGTVRLAATQVAFESGSGVYWGWDDGLVRVDPSRGVTVRRTRRPGDRRWLRESFGGPAVAPDGRVAIVSDGIAIFSPDGDPLETLPLDVEGLGTLSFTDRWLVVAEGSWVYLVETATRKSYRFLLPDPRTASGWCVGTSPEGDELWAVDLDVRRLERYALPD